MSWTLGYGSNGEIDRVSSTATTDTGQAPQYGYDRAGDLTDSRPRAAVYGCSPRRDPLDLQVRRRGPLATARADGNQITYAYDGDGNLVSENELKCGGLNPPATS